MKYSNIPIRGVATILIMVFTLLATADEGKFGFNNDGSFEAKSVNGDYTIAVGGRYQHDFNRFEGVINENKDATTSDFFTRRSRLKIGGKIKDWDYKFSYNLNNGGSIDVASLSYDGFGDMLNLTLGQQKEYLGLEETASSASITAIERSLPSNAFSVGKNVGVKVSGANDLLTYSFGTYRESIEADDNSLDNAVTGRLVVRPISKKSKTLHFGVGFTKREGQFDKLGSRLGVRGGKDRAANEISVRYRNDVFASEFQAWNFEAAAIMGRYHLSAEYFDGELSDAFITPDVAAPKIGVTGYYVEAGWMLTGERRDYKKSSARIGGVSSQDRRVAWEVFARFDQLDVNDNPIDPIIDIDGGSATTSTVGFNWYVGGSTKVAVNYILAKSDLDFGGKTTGSALAARIQYDF